MPQRFKVTRSRLRKPMFYSSSPATMTVGMPASLACKWSIGHSDTRGALRHAATAAVTQWHSSIGRAREWR